jgi:4'-phosphopantetheinyl transferase
MKRQRGCTKVHPLYKTMSTPIYWTLAEAPQDPLENKPGFLAASEREKLSTLRFPKRREEWLLGRWAAKSLVQSIPAYQQVSLDEIEIRNNPEGAPQLFLDGTVSKHCLTISHRDRFAFCATTTATELRIGADLEMVEPRISAFVTDYFTTLEQDLVNPLPAAVKETAVSLIWSVKESMLKALVVGQHWDTRQVEVGEITGLETDPSGPADWHRLQVRDAAQADRCWAAWWLRRGPFILTVAGFSDQIDPWTAVLAEQPSKNDQHR